MGGQPIAPLEKRELAIRTTEYDRVALPHIVAIADAAEPLVRRNSPPKTPHSSWEAGRVSPGVPPTPRKRELPVRTTESDRVVQPHVVAIADATEPLVWRKRATPVRKTPIFFDKTFGPLAGGGRGPAAAAGAAL